MHYSLGSSNCLFVDRALRPIHEPSERRRLVRCQTLTGTMGDWSVCPHRYTTNAIESLHSQVRKAIRNKGHFPSDEAPPS